MGTKDERSLLLYCESCATDQVGRMNVQNLNESDHAILATWKENGYVKSGRVVWDDGRGAGGMSR